MVTAREKQRVEECFQRIAGDLAMICDRPFSIRSVAVEKATTRAAGPGQVHISFKLGFEHKGQILHGSLLVPLPDAVTIASSLMMIPREFVAGKRGESTLDQNTKDALLEVGGFIAGSLDTVLRTLWFAGLRVRSESCQGVRADVRPAFAYTEGQELVVGRAQAELDNWPPFEMLLMLPSFVAVEAA